MPEKLRLPVLLREGFRVFFLAGPIYGMLAIALWMGWLALHAAGGTLTHTPFAGAPHQWHAHEMIFGYGAAVMAGFFLTAVPNWTGSEPARELYISSIALLWLAGRVAVFFSAALPGILVAAIDVLFIPMLGFKIFVNLLKRPKPQNMLFLAILTMMFAANVMVHMEWIGTWDDTASPGNRMGLLTLAALIAILGGRVTPAFTRNALLRGGNEANLPVNRVMFDRLGVASAVAIALIYPFSPPAWLAASLAGIAGVSNAVRLAGWKSLSVLDQPIVWSLHLGFAFLALGYLALAANLIGLPIGETSALHLFAIGAVGGMTLAIMSRAALGHTGRPLVVSKPIAAAYALVAVSALVRSIGPSVTTGSYYLVMFISGLLWIAAFAIFAAFYAPIVTSRRQDEAN